MNKVIQQYISVKKFSFFYWSAIFVLFFFPVGHSFFVNTNKLVSLIIMNKNYTDSVSMLSLENKGLRDKLRYYNSMQGMKRLIKERLTLLEADEMIVKFAEDKIME